MNMLDILSNVHFAHIECYWKFFLLHYTQVSVSTSFTEQIIPILCILCYNSTLVTWTIISLTTASYIFYVWLHPVLYSKHVHSHDFVWLLLVACTILIYNRVHMEGWKLCANCGLMCTLENFQWCAEPCFACGAIISGRCLLLIPRQDKCKSLLTWSVPCGGLV
jgi:hypothetical protein